MESAERIFVEHEGGKAFIYEAGGGYSRTGSSQIIAGPSGEPLRPVEVYTKGKLACNNHAKFIARPGDIVVRARLDRGVVRTFAMKLTNVEGEYAEYEEITPIPEYLYAAASAAAEKCECYHCRHTHFVAE